MKKSFMNDYLLFTKALFQIVNYIWELKILTFGWIQDRHIIKQYEFQEQS